MERDAYLAGVAELYDGEIIGEGLFVGVRKKVFFFEKKNQKTFIPLCALPVGGA